MSLQTQAPLTKGLSVNEDVLGFKVEYNYEYEAGKKPVFIRGRATKEDSPVVYEAALFLENNILQTTTHNASSTTDYTIFNTIATDIFQIAESL